MVYVITGLVFILIGIGNLATGRLHPERPNAETSRRLGYVGIAVGCLILIAGIADLAGLIPEPPNQPVK